MVIHLDKILLKPEITAASWCNFEWNQILGGVLGWRCHWHVGCYARLWVTTFKTQLKGYSTHEPKEIESIPLCSRVLFQFTPTSLSPQGTGLRGKRRQETWNSPLGSEDHKQCAVGPHSPSPLLRHPWQLSHAPRQNEDLLSPQVALRKP